MLSLCSLLQKFLDNIRQRPGSNLLPLSCFQKYSPKIQCKLGRTRQREIRISGSTIPMCQVENRFPFLTHLLIGSLILLQTQSYVCLCVKAPKLSCRQNNEGPRSSLHALMAGYFLSDCFQCHAGGQRRTWDSRQTGLSTLHVGGGERNGKERS